METRKTLFQSTILAYLLMQFKNGVQAIHNNKRKTTLAFFMLLLALAGFAKLTAPAPDLLAHLFQPFACVLYVLAVSIAGAVAVTLSAIPKGARQTAQAFIRAHMVNAAGEPPLLLSRKEDEAGKGVLKLFTRGIPLSQFQDNIDPINSALNCHITRTTQGADKQTVMLYYSPGYAKLPDTIMLPQNISLGLSEVLLGETLEGPKIWDMNVQANALYGGSTGSGKTTLAITLICCLQRPDATALPGSIKNNLNLIVAGKSQPVLSQILLGNNDAWDRIPSYERGMFLTQDGTLFRGYLLDPDTLKPVKTPDNVEGGENP